MGGSLLEHCTKKKWWNNQGAFLVRGNWMEVQTPNQGEMLHMAGIQKSRSLTGKTEKEGIPDCILMIFW